MQTIPTLPSQATQPPNTDPRRSQKGSGFRKDIQGLRAIAVGIVVLYHLWPNRLPGGFIGVDVFLVISGYLITTHLISRPPRTISDVVDFWGRRIRRLLPASLLVLATTGVATFFFAPESIWADTGRQLLTSAFYVVNWEFASSSVDYLESNNAPSPVQHFWSLSVEEQFYFVWPVIIGLAVAFGLALRRVHTVVASTVVLIFVASLIFSVWYTGVQPAAAYFITPTRMWELAAGGLVALFVTYLRPGRHRWSSVLAWVGVVGIILGSFFITPDMPFPGIIAMVPVASTMLIIVADCRGPRSPLPLLSLRPAQFLGNISYSVYLWHWPLIVLVPYVSDNLGRLDKALIIVVAVLLAWASTEMVEKRFRAGPWLRTRVRTFGLAAVGMVLVGGLGLSQMWASQAIIDEGTDTLQSALADPQICVGAEALDPAAAGKPGCSEADSLLMDPAAAETDKSNAYADGCWSNIPFDKRPTCTYGDGETQVALIGNSHAGHWLPALEKLAEKNDWTITTFLISRCTVSTEFQSFDTNAKSQACRDYTDWTMEQTTSGKYDSIVTSERQSVPLRDQTWEETETNAPGGYTEPLKQWSDAGLDILVIRDTPFPGTAKKDIPDCVAANEDDLSQCEGTPESWYWMDPLAETAKSMERDNIAVIDPQAWVCPEGTCRPAIGGVITYFDDSHITATYAQTLAPLLGEAIDGTGLETLK
ncbi:Peptidoglycan/LPS O-acetylase OafA/YrhL, contains acyltransferase and SGNH-hydrolase domains [Brevibacterium sandarakinum]|uniref:Peptidoglycan/LPS O-acetylase OafA/YrhL, contains acyltransferase and SGNH-hydrolase domains n=1 Tax=Brevibacterium sandarakinum TaxID=629680 RepID=A0A1H1V0V7_BRESA|nr:acyltransferase family protein [Brevibacterium sandarakinum]SDS78151.1 Peptidoglycan/LPS O-acetylase OafA/YrhL, contains acyltransferase and SGNH-hydrolase domains [Brevibacterium sandarakinum]